jgi:hypothetical protein
MAASFGERAGVRRWDFAAAGYLEFATHFRPTNTEAGRA